MLLYVFVFTSLQRHSGSIYFSATVARSMFCAFFFVGPLHEDLR